MLIDAHIHLQAIQDLKTRTTLLDQIAKVHVEKLICNGIQPEDWSGVDEIAQGNERVLPFFGVHPWYADKVVSGWDAVLEHFLKKTEAGIGEVGLDKLRTEIDWRKQIEVFQRQLQIAKELSKPLAIHCVRAWGDLLLLLKQHLSSGMRFMTHSYRGSLEVMRELLDLGAYISFSWKSFQHQTGTVNDLIKEVPLERLLLETDFPYIEPHKIGTDISVERYFECLRGTYALAARAKGMNETELEKAVWENGQAFLHRTTAR